MKDINLEKINTENINNTTKNIDQLSTLEMVTLINQEDHKPAQAIAKVLPSISAVVDAAVNVLNNDGRIIYIGAGTSGRVGVMDASEMEPTYNIDSDRVIGVMAGGVKALYKSLEAVEDDPKVAITDLKTVKFSDRDILIGVAASGRTPYVVSAIKYANSIGAVSVGIANSLNSEIGKIAKYKIEVPVGGEVVTGSTRMKAGTAQKMILNMISTSAMIKIGKVYHNLMVDIKIGNLKLRSRAHGIIKEITKASLEVIKKTLIASGDDVKVAIVMIMKQVTKEVACLLIQEAKGMLREII